MTNPSACKILIVIVIYNQRITETNVYKTLLSENETVFIYDNSPTSQPIDSLPKKWIYIHDPSNPGLSKAYNIAAKYASTNGYSWILISDQDTSYPANAIERYRAYIGYNIHVRMFIPKVRLQDTTYLSPIKSRFYVSRISTSVPSSGEIKLKNYAVINSGILVTTDSFLSCGGYNDKVFLDFSDFQFIERFESQFKTAYLTDIVIQQNFSDKSDTPAKKLHRFEIFCQSLEGYECIQRKDLIFIRLTILRRAIALTIKIRSLKPIKKFLRRYIFKS